MIEGKPMVEHVYERVAASGLFADVVVATDDERIFKAVNGFGGKAMMTLSSHRTGTERCFEVMEKLGVGYDALVNIQGDEPRIDTTQLQQVLWGLEQGADIATLRKAIAKEEELFSENVVKVVCDSKGRVLYFSRQPIPFVRGCRKEEWMQKHTFYKHIGVYAFRTDVVDALKGLRPSELEAAESLEQLRWIENGYEILAVETQVENAAVDTPEDLLKFK